MYLGEVLFRQGWWVKKFETEKDAEYWTVNQAMSEEPTANPPMGCRVRELKLPDTPPQPPVKTFDEAWSPPT